MLGERAVASGAFERSIALHRTTYTHVLQTRGWLPDAVGGITWFGPHAAHGMGPPRTCLPTSQLHRSPFVSIAFIALSLEPNPTATRLTVPTKRAPVGLSSGGRVYLVRPCYTGRVLCPFPRGRWACRSP